MCPFQDSLQLASQQNTAAQVKTLWLQCPFPTLCWAWKKCTVNIATAYRKKMTVKTSQYFPENLHSFSLTTELLHDTKLEQRKSTSLSHIQDALDKTFSVICQVLRTRYTMELVDVVLWLRNAEWFGIKWTYKFIYTCTPILL